MMNKLSKKKTIYYNYLKKGKKNSSFNLKKKREDETILGILHFKTFDYKVKFLLFFTY